MMYAYARPIFARLAYGRFERPAGFWFLVSNREVWFPQEENWNYKLETAARTLPRSLLRSARAVTQPETQNSKPETAQLCCAYAA
jgi:hypothetical protein